MLGQRLIDKWFLSIERLGSAATRRVRRVERFGREFGENLMSGAQADASSAGPAVQGLAKHDPAPL